MQKPWSLYNKQEKLRIDDLTPQSVKLILLSIPMHRMQEWYACQEGDLHWQPIGAIAEFYEDVRQLKGTEDAQTKQAAQVSADESPTRTEQARRPLFEEVAAELLKTNTALLVEKEQIKERRTARRYDRRLQFLIVNGDKKFATQTLNISMNGMALEQKLPAWVPATFKAELGFNNHKIRVKCQRVTDDKLKLLEADAWDVLRQWIVNW